MEKGDLPFDEAGGVLQPLSSGRQAPWAKPGPLGWQAPPKGAGVRIHWAAEPEARAVVEMDRNLGRRIQWNILRALAPPGTGVRVTAEVRAAPPQNSDVVLEVELAGSTKPLNRRASRGESGWQDLTVDVPPQPKGAVLRISLLRDQRGFLDPGVEPRLEWRAVRLEPLGEEPARD